MEHVAKKFDLQLPQQRFGDCVVPAIALAAHRPLRCEGRQAELEVIPRIMAAPIQIEDQPRRRPSSELDHAQRVDHNADRHRFAHRKVNDLVTQQIDHHRQFAPENRPAKGWLHQKRDYSDVRGLRQTPGGLYLHPVVNRLIRNPQPPGDGLYRESAMNKENSLMLALKRI